MEKNKNLMRCYVDDSSTDLPVCSSEEASPRNCVPQPTDEEMSQLFEALNLTGTKPAILSLIAPYSD